MNVYIAITRLEGVYIPYCTVGPRHACAALRDVILYGHFLLLTFASNKNVRRKELALFDLPPPSRRKCFKKGVTVFIAVYSSYCLCEAMS